MPVVFLVILAVAAGCGGGGDSVDPGEGTVPVAGAVSVSGTWAVGSTLTASPTGFALGTPAGSYHYAWQRCTDSGCSAATVVGTDAPSYVLVPGDVDGWVRVGAYAINDCASGCGQSATAWSSAALVPGAAPVAGSVSISGAWAVDATLTASPSGFALGTPAGSYHYRWQRCADFTCATPTEVGADAAAYTVVAGDDGAWLRVGVFVTNACASGCGQSATAWSGVVPEPPDFDWAHWPMPDSATIYCTDGSAYTSCPSPGESSYGQDGNYTINAPSYTTTVEKVLDDVTGLRWQRTLPSASYTWSDAKAYCATLTLEGVPGWRLPTVIELLSISDFGRSNPAIDTVAFPGTPAVAFFWSSTPYAADPGRAWGVHSGTGYDSSKATTDTWRVRCVR